MLALGVNPDAMSGRKIAVVGPSTAGAVTEEWKAPDCMPDVFTSIYIADAMGDIGKQNVLLLRGDLATEALPNALAERGATVMDAIAYRLVKTEMSLIGDDKRVPDAIAITSGENAVAAIQALQSLGFEHWLRHVPIICMGPNTAEAVRRLGFRPSDVANPHSVEGLLAATERVLGGVVCAAT
jgi:uroporphyrinogen-III synthase